MQVRVAPSTFDSPMRIDTRAFGIAGGTLAVVCLLGGTALWLLGGRDPGALAPLGAVLFGYSASVVGAVVGSLWAYAYGFLIAAGFAFVYNLALAPAAPPPTQ